MAGWEIYWIVCLPLRTTCWRRLQIQSCCSNLQVLVIKREKYWFNIKYPSVKKCLNLIEVSAIKKHTPHPETIFSTSNLTNHQSTSSWDDAFVKIEILCFFCLPSTNSNGLVSSTGLSTPEIKEMKKMFHLGNTKSVQKFSYYPSNTDFFSETSCSIWIIILLTMSGVQGQRREGIGSSLDLLRLRQTFSWTQSWINYSQLRAYYFYQKKYFSYF